MDKQADIIRFGNDGWHGRYDDDFTEANVLRIADALGQCWSNSDLGSTVYVGYDRRRDGASLAYEASRVLAAYGLHVCLSQSPCPTPAVAWTCAQDSHSAGALILSASERSCEYGGVLVRAADGGSCSRTFFNEVEHCIAQVPPTERGEVEQIDFMDSYEDVLISYIDKETIQEAHLKLVVDPMFGAASTYLADLLRKIGCSVTEIHYEDHKDFDGIHPVPQDPWADECEQTVVAQDAHMGILLDGDADRAALVDEQGSLIPAWLLTALIMEHLVENRGGRGRIVTTLSCSALLSRQAKRLGCENTRVPVGFSRIYQEVLEKDVLLGAEEYGGICLPMHLYERDALLVGLLATELCAVSHAPLSRLVKNLESQIGTMRYARRDLRLDPAAIQTFRNILPGLNPHDIAGKVPVDVNHADGLRLQFKDDSWVLMRPSRTEALVRIYAEAPTEADRDELLEQTCMLVRRGV